MSVVIVGGNECMERRYKEVCESYDCKAKVYTKLVGGMKHIGAPDLLVLFTNTMSHKMLRTVLSETKGQRVRIARSHTSSIAALKGILDTHVAAEGNGHV